MVTRKLWLQWHLLVTSSTVNTMIVIREKRSSTIYMYLCLRYKVKIRLGNLTNSSKYHSLDH